MNPIMRAKRLLELSEKAWSVGYTDGSGPEVITEDNKAVAVTNWGCSCCKYETNEAEKEEARKIVEIHNHAPEIAKLFLEAVEVIKETYYVCICDGWYEHDNVVRNPDCSSCQAGEFLKKIEGGE